MPLQVLQEKSRYILGIAAGKGGVGKQTVAILLVAALARRGQRVGLFDADPYGSSLGKMMEADILSEKKERKWRLVCLGIVLLFIALEEISLWKGQRSLFCRWNLLKECS